MLGGRNYPTYREKTNLSFQTLETKNAQCATKKTALKTKTEAICTERNFGP
jgi:hypothetical protein